MNLAKMQVVKDNPAMGMAVYSYLSMFDETFHKSANVPFANFFRKYHYITKWMMVSDYAFYDKKKTNDVVTFSFIPYSTNFHEVSEFLDKLSRADIKHLSAVNDEFIDFIKNSPILNVSIILDRDRRLEFHNERKIVQRDFGLLYNMIEKWCETTPESTDRYQEFMADIALMQRELAGSGANMKVIRDIQIISSLAAYLMFEVAKVIPVDKMGWFSDRDALLTYKGEKFKSPIIFNLAHTFYHIACVNHGIDSRNNPMFGLPEQGGRVWYDSFIRIPDLICGTLADYDPARMEKKGFTHEKFIPVLENLLASNDHNLFFKLSFLRLQETFQARRLLLNNVDQQLRIE